MHVCFFSWSSLLRYNYFNNTLSLSLSLSLILNDNDKRLAETFPVRISLEKGDLGQYSKER